MSDRSANQKAASTRSTIGILLTKLAIFPLSFLVTISIVHDLGQADFGKYSYLNVLMGFAIPMLSFGFGQGITYLVGSERFRVEDVQTPVVGLGAVFGLLTAAVIFGLWKAGLLNAITNVPLRLMVIALCVMPVQGINLMLYRLSMGASWFVVMNLIDIAKFTVTPLLLLLFVIFLGWKLDGAVYALVGRELILFVFTAALVWSRIPFRIRIPRGFVREGGRYGAKAWIGDLTAMAYTRLDHFLLGSIASDRVYGVYSIAAKVTELLWLPTNSLGPVLFNRIAKVRDEEERVRLTARIHRTVVLLVSLGSIALAAVSPWAIPWVFGAENASAVWPAIILIPGTVAMVTQKVLTKYFGGRGHPEKSSITTVVGTLAIGALSVVLIPRLGAEGSALASTVSYFAMALTALILYRGMTRPRPLHLYNPSVDDVRWAWERIREAVDFWRDRYDWRRKGAP